HNRNFDWRGPQQFAISFYIDASGAAFTSNRTAVSQLNLWNLPFPPDQRACHIGKIHQAVVCLTHHQPQIAAPKVGAGSEFPKNTSKIPDTHCQQLSQVRPRFAASFNRELSGETLHSVAHPQVPGLQVVSSHTDLLFQPGRKRIEQVRVNSHSGSYGEVTAGGAPLEVEIRDPSERHAPR